MKKFISIVLAWAMTCLSMSGVSAKTTVSFKAVGDNLIHGGVYKQADYKSGKMNDGKYDFSFLYTELKDDLKKADISFLNQETILGGYGASGYPRFCTPDDMVKAIDGMGIDVLNGATNHSLDKGNSGVQHQIKVLNKYPNIKLIGLFSSKANNSTIKVVKRKGLKFAFLAYTYGTNGIKGNGWNVAMFSESRVRSDVRKAKKLADFVIVSAHWGTEYTFKTTSYQKKYAKIMTEEGVDLVVGTHPHVIEPMEWRTGKNGHKTLVVYSLGNFVSTQNKRDRLLEGMFSCNFVKNGSKKSITNVVWTPLVNHYERVSASYGTIGNQKIYKLKNYTTTMAKKHKISVTRNYFVNKTKEVIGKKFKIDL